MHLLDSLAIACSLHEIENIWTLYLADAFAQSAVKAWHVRWTFPEFNNIAVNIRWGSSDIIERFLADRTLLTDNVLALEHPQLPAGLYIAGTDQPGIRHAFDQFTHGQQALLALINSFHALRAYFAAQTAQTLLQSELPVMLLGPDATIHKCSALAFTLVNGEGSQLRFADNRQIAFKSLAHETAFKAALANAFAQHRLPQRLRCAGFCMTITASSPSRHPIASVVLRILNQAPKVDVRELQGELGLTLSQARLAKALIHGETLQAYAQRTGLTLKGVKWHLHPLMRKLDCPSRDQLILKLLRWAG